MVARRSVLVYTLSIAAISAVVSLEGLREELGRLLRASRKASGGTEFVIIMFSLATVCMFSVGIVAYPVQLGARHCLVFYRIKKERRPLGENFMVIKLQMETSKEICRTINKEEV